MTQIFNQISLNQLRCLQHDQIANFICLDKQCQKRGLSCPICETIYHKDHTFKPFKYFISQLIQPQSRSNLLTLISAQIDLNIQQIQQSINKITPLEDKQELQKVFHSYTNEMKHKINHELFQIVNDLKQFFQSLNSNTGVMNADAKIKKINSFINQLELHQYELQIQPQKKLTNQQKFLYQMLELIKQKKQDLFAFIKAKSDIKDILGLFIFTQVKQKLNFTFSQELHHTAIKITDKLTAKQQHNYSSNFALIQPMIIGKKKSLDKKTVKIKIDKLNSWINLGVCIKSKAMSNSYYFNTQDIGHGAYTISNDGYSWHNVDSSSNSFYHGWSFAQGDIIIMTYDPKSKMIKYSKENGDKEHEMACEPVIGEEMYFCVTLNTHDQSVSIVQ